MRRVPLLLVVCLAAVAAASCHRLIQPARPPFTVTGIVAAIGADALTLRHKSGQRVRITFTPATAVSRRSRPAAIADIAVGMRIVVRYRQVEGALVADEVLLFRSAI